MRIKRFEFNMFPVNTYVLWDETKEAVIIDPGCFYEEENVGPAIGDCHGAVPVWLHAGTHAHGATYGTAHPGAHRAAPGRCADLCRCRCGQIGRAHV